MNDTNKGFDHYYNLVTDSIKINRIDNERIEIDIAETLEATFSCMGCSGIIFGVFMFILFANDHIVWFSWFYPYWFGIAILGIILRMASNNYYVYDTSKGVLQYHVSLFSIRFNWSWVTLSEFDRLSVSSNKPESHENTIYDCQFLLQFPSVPNINLGASIGIPSEFINQIGERLAESIGINYLPGIQGQNAPKRYIHSESTLLELVELSEISNKIPLLIETPSQGSIFGKLAGLSTLGGFLCLILDVVGITPGQMKYTPVFFFTFFIFLALEIIHVSYYIFIRDQGILVYCRRWLKSSSIKRVQYLSDLEKLEAMFCTPLENGKISFHYSLNFKKDFYISFGGTIEADTYEEINKYGKKIAQNLGTSYTEVSNIT